MKIEFLGTGTSTGVPQIGCKCDVCTSTDPRDKRLRASAVVTLDSGANILIDCGPDFRTQILRAGSPALEALLITHTHYDHVGGIDDLRPYCKHDRHFPTYCRADVAHDLRTRNPWSFAEHLYPGVPTFAIHEVEEDHGFEIAGQEIMPVRVMHGKLPILGYRIGPLGYVTDCKTMPEETVEALHGLDVLVLNALHHPEHPSHMNLEQALALAERIGARRTYFTHMSHYMGRHADLALPEGIALASDGLVVDIS